MSTSTPSARRVLRILAVTDSTGMNYISHTQIENLINNNAQSLYDSVGIKLYITGYFDWYYTSSASVDTYLSTFMNYIKTQTSYASYDLAFLFTGKAWSTGQGNYYTIGSSYIRGAGTALDPTDSKTTYGFAMGTVNSMFSSTTIWQNFAHEVGHSLNGVHDQADPSFKDPNGNYTNPSTIMGYGSTKIVQFSDGTTNSGHNNAQRIRAFASVTLHYMDYYKYGGDYGSSPSDNILMNDYEIILKDIPSLNDKITYASYKMTYTGTSPSSITLGYLYMGVYAPNGNNYDYGHTSSVMLQSGQTRTFTWTNGLTFSQLGQWRTHPSYYYNGHWASYYSDAIYPSVFATLGSKNSMSYRWDSAGGKVDFTAPFDNAGNKIMCWSFKLLSFSSTFTTGSTVYSVWTAFNTNSYVFSGATMITSCQAPNGVWKDFTLKSEPTWTKRSATSNGDQFDDVWNSNGNPGGGDAVWLSQSNTIDQTGRWRFFPELRVGNTYPSWYAYEIDLTA